MRRDVWRGGVFGAGIFRMSCSFAMERDLAIDSRFYVNEELYRRDAENAENAEECRIWFSSWANAVFGIAFQRVHDLMTLFLGELGDLRDSPW